MCILHNFSLETPDFKYLFCQFTFLLFLSFVLGKFCLFSFLKFYSYIVYNI